MMQIYKFSIVSKMTLKRALLRLSGTVKAKSGIIVRKVKLMRSEDFKRRLTSLRLSQSISIRMITDFYETMHHNSRR